MPDRVITDIRQITPERLTEILRRDGALQQGEVTALDMNVNERELSTGVKLGVTYSTDARGTLPRKLFLKLVNAQVDEDEYFGPSEVDYYVRDYVGVEGVPIPHCYDGAYSAALHRYHILLDDLSDTHMPSYERAPTLEHGFALADAMAALHAPYWGAARLEAAGALIHDASHVRRYAEIALAGSEFIIEGCADQLAAHWPALIRDTFARHPQALVERSADLNGFTLIHGDANLSNILIPRDGDRPLYVVDRQPFDWGLTTWLGVYDLAYTMVLKWDTQLRREFEQPVLARYHAQLIERGVVDYGWDQLWSDYRLCIPICVYVATEWCRTELRRDTMEWWMPMLQRTLTAMDDHDCAALY
ncbi:MAG: phosphotransferase [Chloroflexi bacterium]|nr:phosphotransferase [Chloroflexota bacterium]